MPLEANTTPSPPSHLPIPVPFSCVPLDPSVLNYSVFTFSPIHNGHTTYTTVHHHKFPITESRLLLKTQNYSRSSPWWFLVLPTFSTIYCFGQNSLKLGNFVSFNLLPESTNLPSLIWALKKKIRQRCKHLSFPLLSLIFPYFLKLHSVCQNFSNEMDVVEDWGDSVMVSALCTHSSMVCPQAAFPSEVYVPPPHTIVPLQPLLAACICLSRSTAYCFYWIKF